jgi:hypothetical protein
MLSMPLAAVSQRSVRLGSASLLSVRYQAIGHVRLLQTRGLNVAGESLSLAHGAQPCATWTLIDAPT